MAATYTITYSGKRLNGSLITGTTHESAFTEEESKNRAFRRVKLLYPDIEEWTVKVYVVDKSEDEDEGDF